MRSMIIRTPMQTSYVGVKHIAVSLPRVEAIMDGKNYLEPEDVPRLQGTELRRAPRR
jgi:hypothetical protein